VMSEIKAWGFWRAVLAECLGTIVFVFVFIGLSAAIGDRNNSYPDQEIKVALAFGLAVATLAQCLGHVSAAHLNPAITLGLLVSCKISPLRALVYMSAQVVGAVAGSVIVYGTRPETTHSLGVNKLNGVGPGQGFGVEFLLTLQLVLCVLAVTDQRRDVGGFAPLAVGLSVALGPLGHLAGISFTGCGINPAQSFGPAILQDSFDNHWVYWAGPMCAGVVAALLYDYLLAPRKDPCGEKTRGLLCRGSKQEKDHREPLLEEVSGEF
uniref:Aquaporin 1a (Colton blood group), tandem duplicate 2 n=1 Tax=Gasterosteus aculeatus aculeatus TaxID=481459 RepID=A0AAQ4PWP3_GASAC